MSASDLSELDPIIRRVERQQPSRPGEQYLTVLTGSGDINPSWFRRGERYTYRIVTEDAGQAWARGASNTIHVSDPGTNDTIDLMLAYQAICPSGNEEKLAKAIGRDGSPSNEFRGRITAWTRAFVRGREQELFFNFDRFREALLAHVSDLVETNVGLTFHGRLDMNLAEHLASHRVEEYLEVRFRDSQLTQQLLLQCDLDIVPELRARAVAALHRLKGVRSSIVQTTQVYFRREVAAQEFVQGFRQSPHIGKLKQELDVVAAKQGRAIIGLEVAPQNVEALPEPIFADLSDDVTPAGQSEAITLKSTIQLTLSNLAEFQRANVENIGDWLKLTFKTVVRDISFQKKYLDFLRKSSWQEIENAIKSAMEGKAAEIGYRVKQIISRPYLKELIAFGEPATHHFRLAELPLKSASPALFGVTVGATFKIVNWDLERNAELINQRIDLKANIQDELRKALTTELAPIIPNDFILKFTESEPGTVSLEAKLREATKKRLIETYDAEVDDVVVTPIETEEIRRVRELLNEPRDVPFTATPHDGGELVQFELTWRVVNIDLNSWEVISKPSCNVENIRKRLSIALEVAFSTVPYSKLRFADPAAQQDLSKLAARAVTECATATFGLVISVEDLRRAPTHIEGLARDEWVRRIEDKLRSDWDAVLHNRELSVINREHALRMLRARRDVELQQLNQYSELSNTPVRNDMEEARFLELKKSFEPPSPPTSMETGIQPIPSNAAAASSRTATELNYEGSDPSEFNNVIFGGRGRVDRPAGARPRVSDERSSTIEGDPGAQPSPESPQRSSSS